MGRGFFVFVFWPASHLAPRKARRLLLLLTHLINYSNQQKQQQASNHSVNTTAAPISISVFIFSFRFQFSIWFAFRDYDGITRCVNEEFPCTNATFLDKLRNALINCARLAIWSDENQFRNRSRIRIRIRRLRETPKMARHIVSPVFGPPQITYLLTTFSGCLPAAC